MNYCRQHSAACSFFKPRNLMKREDEFIKLVCNYLHIPFETIISKCRKHELCEARQVISYILTIYTKLTLPKIAKILNYRSHASPWRDKRQVSFFIDHNKKFAAKYLPLLKEAKHLADELIRRENCLSNIKKLISGDICWFWNENSNMHFPILGTFKYSFFNGENQQRFVNNEMPEQDFSYCSFAGERILPQKFRSKIIDATGPVSVEKPLKSLPETINI
jgi:hypothetical protein